MERKRQKNNKNKYGHDQSLASLARDITFAINSNKDDSDQKAQVELLMKLEEKFRKSVIAFAQSREIYKQFILLVAVTNRNILSARPFFREKSKTFSSKITPAIRDGDIKALQEFHINFNFIDFIKKKWKGPFPEKSQKIYDSLLEARNKLIINNTPLAINRAKIFYRKTPQGHLELNDLIGTAISGLISGVDKWVGPYSRVFNGVCIGRMTGNLIDAYSETVLHFYPSDKIVLYRANSLKFKKGIHNLKDLADEINFSYEEDRKNGIKTPKERITPEQLSDLLNAASPISADSSFTASSDDDGAYSFSILDNAPNNTVDSLEDDFIKKDLLSKMILSIRNLPVIQQKILILKGVKL